MNKKLLCLLIITCLVGCEKEEVEKVGVKEQEEIVVKGVEVEKPKEVVVKEKPNVVEKPVVVKEKPNVVEKPVVVKEKPIVVEKPVVVKEKPIEKQPQVKLPATPELPISKQDIQGLVDLARETQWKVFDGEYYTINQVKELYNPYFTQTFIDRFIFERMTAKDIDGETKYYVPASDDMTLIIMGDAYSWTDKTNIKYYQENSINFIKVSEYKKHELYAPAYGNFVYVIIFKEIDSKYKIENIIYEWE
mgnify:CR=1 FL=1